MIWDRGFDGELPTCVALALALSLSTAVAAEPPRKIDFQVVLKDLDNKPMNWDCETLSEDKRDCSKWREATLWILATTALTKQWPNEELKIEDQIRRTMLAQEIYKSTSAELDSKDIDLLCNQIAKLVSKASLSTIFTLRAIEILDPVRLKRGGDAK